MQTIRPTGKQTLLDIAITHYGNEDAVLEILELNPELIFVLGSLVGNNIDVIIDETSPLRNEFELRKLNGEIVATGQNLRPHSLSSQYFNVVYNAYNKVVLYRDMAALDRLVRDLHGEPNEVYATYDQWSNRFGGFCLYPMFSGNEDVKGLNLASIGLLDLGWASAGSFEKPYYAPTVPGVYKMSSFIYGGTLSENDIACGVFVLNEADGDLMGGMALSNTIGFGLRVLSGDLLFTCTGLDVSTTYAEKVGWGNKSGLIMGDSYGGDVSVWHNATMEDSAAFDLAYVSMPMGDPTIGIIDGGGSSNDKPNKIAFAFACRGFGLSAQGLAEQKAFCNAVHYYMYQRGVLKSFTPFI